MSTVLGTLGGGIKKLASYRRSRLEPRLSFVVTALPRSATRYASTLFTQLGYPCGHEAIFDVPSSTWKTVLWRLLDPQMFRYIADSSWVSAPNLDNLPLRTTIFHQLRNPVHVVRSLMSIGFFERSRSHRLYGYSRFAINYLDGAPVSALEKCMLFWIRWNQIIERQAALHPYLRYRIEDLSNCNWYTLEEIAELLPHQTPKSLASVIQRSPRNVNHRGKLGSIEWADFPSGFLKERLESTALHYGYTLQDLECA